MTDRKRKRAIKLFLSSSSSSSSSSEEESEVEEDDDDDEEEEEEISGDGYDCSNDDDNNNEEEDEENEGNNDDESLCKRVISLLKEGNDLEVLNLRECKAYLRQHGLRLAGTKAVCIQRIKDHWRMKDGNGEALYQRSSFVINCTGDVCKGDVVLFTQKVYEKFDKVTRHGKLLGKRTVAGKVVKESYGSAKQQHTFTVEVLWSKGIKKLPPLFPLLVKGRNLYKLKTYRQCWNNETERTAVLAEKHKRGTAARLVRAMKKSKKIQSANRGVKHQKCTNHKRPILMRKTAEPERRKHVRGCRKDTLQQWANFDNHHHIASPPRQLNFRRNVKSEGSEASWRHQKLGHPTVDMRPRLQSYAHSPHNPYISRRESHHRSVPLHLSGYDMGSASTIMTLPPSRHFADTIVMPAPQCVDFRFQPDR